MTLIMGLVRNGESIIASDTQGSTDFTKGQYKNKKIFKKGDFLFAGTGSYRQLQLLEHSFTIPARNVDQKTDDYMFSLFVPAIKTFLKENDTVQTESGVDTNSGAAYIIIYDKRIFVFYSDFSFLEPEYNFVTEGSGSYHSFGAMKALLSHDKNIKNTDLLQIAFDVTSDIVMSVGGKLETIKIADEKDRKTK